MAEGPTSHSSLYLIATASPRPFRRTDRPVAAIMLRAGDHVDHPVSPQQQERATCQCLDTRAVWALAVIAPIRVDLPVTRKRRAPRNVGYFRCSMAAYASPVNARQYPHGVSRMNIIVSRCVGSPTTFIGNGTCPSRLASSPRRTPGYPDQRTSSDPVALVRIVPMHKVSCACPRYFVPWRFLGRRAERVDSVVTRRPKPEHSVLHCTACN